MSSRDLSTKILLQPLSQTAEMKFCRSLSAVCCLLLVPQPQSKWLLGIERGKRESLRCNSIDAIYQPRVALRLAFLIRMFRVFSSCQFRGLNSCVFVDRVSVRTPARSTKSHELEPRNHTKVGATKWQMTKPETKLIRKLSAVS